MAPSTIMRSERVMLLIFAGAAGAIGLVALIAGALRIRLYALASAGDATPVALLTEAQLPGVPTDGDPQIVFGAFPTADLLVAGLSGTTRALLAVGEGLGALVVVVVSAGVGWLFVAVSRGRPFARSLYALALIAGATLALGSMLGQGLSGFGRMNAAVELNPVTGDLFRIGFAFDPAPIVIGFAIMALAYVFRAGTRLQRDTDGLV
jgi:hypothetical protein